MKLLVIFLFCNLCSFANAKGLRNWVLLEKKDSSLVYSIDKKNETLLALQKSQLKDKKKFNSKLAQELENAKRQVLKLTGIENWKISQSHMSSNRMEWNGSYTNGNHELIYFFEVHYFSKDLVEVHYLLTSRFPISNELLDEVKGQEGVIEQ